MNTVADHTTVASEVQEFLTAVRSAGLPYAVVRCLDGGPSAVLGTIIPSRR